MWRAHRTGELALRRFGAALTVRSDFTFTLPAVIIQPLSGAFVAGIGALDAAARKAGVLARRLARGLATRGAMPCLDLIDLQDYLAGLEGLDITVLAEDA